MKPLLILTVIKDLVKLRLHVILNTANHKLKSREHAERKKFYSSFLNPGDLCFDIGANFGNRTKVFIELGNRVVAAEPQTKCYYYLKMLFGKKIELIKKGLSDKEGIATMFVDSSTTISSVSPEWIESVKKTRFTNSQWNKRETINMTTLDKLISEFGKPAFIKIDVEGHELPVIKGLSQPVPLLCFEYTTPEQADKACDCLDYLRHLDNSYACNYSIGESNAFVLEKWTPVSDMITFIKTHPDDLRGFGDIYVKQPAVIIK